MKIRFFLTAMFVLTFVVSASTYAQEAPAPAAAPGATTGLPFVNEGANQPVLQPLSPGAAPIEAPANLEATAEGGEHRKGLPQFDTSTFPRQLFWLTLTFAFLYLMFSGKTLPTIASVLSMRQARIEGDLHSAEDLKKQAEALKGEYEAAIAKAQSDAQKMILDIQSETKRGLEAKDAAFKAKAEEAVAALETKIADNRTRVMKDLISVANDLAADITARITGNEKKAKAA